MMDCEHAAELLPWLLNGTLDATEQTQVREHLAQCGQCRWELGEAMWAGAVYQQHIPTETLIDYAFERPLAAVEWDRVERHFKLCQDCTEQLELVRESRRLDAEGAPEVTAVVVERAPRWPTFRWPYAALAATLVAFIAAGGWLWTWQQGRAGQARLTQQQRELRQQLASQEAENQKLRQREIELRQQQDQANRELARLQEQVKALASPRLNIPILDVYPMELARRAQRPLVNELEIPRDATVVTLILNSQSQAASRAYSLEILNAQNAVVWSSQGLVRHATSDYTISIPTEFLPPGRYTINVDAPVKGKRVRVESYQIVIRKT